MTARGKSRKLQTAEAPPEAMARFEKGRAYFRAGRYREAIVELKAALALDPGSAVLRYNVAYTSELLGDLPEAIEYYRTYLAALPRSAKAERERTRTTLRRLEGRQADIADEDDGGEGAADTLFWVTLGSGAALLAGAGVTGLLALDREDDVAAFVVGRDGSLDGRKSLEDEADTFALASDVLIAAGAALVATSALLFFCVRPRSRKSPRPPAAAAALAPQKESAASRAYERRPRRLIGHPRTVLELHRLDLQELFEAELAELAAVARLLVAAERREQVEAAAVDVDLAGAQAARDALGALGIARPHAAGQPVDGVVGDAHRVVFVLVGDDRQHRAEDLLLRDGHVGAHVGEHGRLDVVALGQPLGRLGAAGDELRALVDRPS